MSDHDWTVTVWGLLGTVVLAGVAASVLSRGRFPGPAVLVARITGIRGGRVVLVVGWMWLGWHAFAR
jgi:hypothetical protein